MNKLTDIQIVAGDISSYACDAIVNDSNNHLFYGGSVNDAILRSGGEEIQAACDAIGEIRMGTAVQTTGGSLPAKHVIHAAATSIGTTARGRDVRSATRAALEIAKELNVGSLAIPPLGTSTGYVTVSYSARLMLPVIAEFLETADYPSSVTFMVTDDALAEEVREVVRELESGDADSEEEPEAQETDAAKE